MVLRLRTVHRKQRGFTLIETLAAAAIVGLVGAGAAGVVFQVLNVNAISDHHLYSVKQVESALHWMSRDVQMAQSVQPGPDAGFPLVLSWVDWDNAGHQVTYSLDNSRLVRSHSVDGGQAADTLVAQNINEGGAATSCAFSNGAVTIKLTAETGGFKPASETRTLQVVPRAAG